MFSLVLSEFSWCDFVMERLIICGHIKNIQGLGLSQPSQESHHGQLESFSAPGVDTVTCCQDPGRTSTHPLPQLEMSLKGHLIFGVPCGMGEASFATALNFHFVLCPVFPSLSDRYCSHSRINICLKVCFLRNCTYSPTFLSYLEL